MLSLSFQGPNPSPHLAPLPLKALTPISPHAAIPLPLSTPCPTAFTDTGCEPNHIHTPSTAFPPNGHKNSWQQGGTSHRQRVSNRRKTRHARNQCREEFCPALASHCWKSLLILAGLCRTLTCNLLAGVLHCNLLHPHTATPHANGGWEGKKLT